MKTSHILAIVAVVIIGLFLFFNESTEPGVDTQDPTAEVQSTENEQPEAVDEEPTVVAQDVEISADAIPEAEVTSEAEIETESSQREFTIDSFGFGYSQEEIRVNQGDMVTINLTNSDGFHDWVVDEFDAATEKISAGGEASVTFVADTAGTFEYYCSVGNHRAQGMVGTLIVE